MQPMNWKGFDSVLLIAQALKIIDIHSKHSEAILKV